MDIDGVRTHFRGQRILTAAITQLARLGMNKATHVLLHGIAWGGTATFLQADYIGSLVRKAVPGLHVYKALPVDGIHPNFATFFAKNFE